MQQGYNPYSYYNPQAYPPPYGQQPPPQQPPHNPYGPYYAPPNPSQGPQPYTFDAAAYTQYPQQDATQSRRQRKHHSFTAAPAQFSAPTPAPPPAPALKSAMKKTMNIFQSADTAMGRQLSYPGQATESRPQTRQRTYSNPARPLQRRESMYNHDQPDSRDLSGDPVTFHMMVSFHSYNELHLEHVYAKALEDIRNIILPIWKDGIESDTILNHTCVIKFRNAPWDMGGPNVKQAYELIKGFFRLTQHKGYSFQTAIGMTTSSPRLIFQVTQPDERAEFFIAFFSQEGRKLTLVDPPGHIDLSIGARLRSAFPYKISSDNVVEEKNRVIEIRRKASSNAPEIDQSVLFVEVLKVLNELNFQLDATIPLPRRGSLGMRSTRELLVFKGYVPQ